MIKKELRDKLVAQATQEIVKARRHKQPKVAGWQLNEQLLYLVKQKSADARANVELGRMMEFINSYLSKVDNPLQFKFTKRKEAQLKRVKRLNALKEADASTGFWDLKDIAGKKQALTYGRAIYCYYADNYDGYKSHLENVDVYDFLIDPRAGGLDLERARYMGRYGIVLDEADLKNGDYIKSEVKNLTQGKSNSTEENNKKPREAAQTASTTTQETDDTYTFWEWYTTYNGERYYLLMQEGGTAVRCERLTDLFPATKNFPKGAFPFWTYAVTPDLTEFWTPAPADQVREIFMAQNVNINQMLDNAEEHNKPMKVVDVAALENLAELKYRKGGDIKVKPGTDAQKAVQFMRPSTIDTPLKVFDKLEQIQEKASGVTAGSKGTSDEDKVGIYEGNQANAADRFGLLNKTYSFGYKRFAQLYELGVRTYLTKKVAIDIIGIDGIETEKVSRRDIFKNDEDFNVIVEASDAEEQASTIDRRNKLQFLGANAQNPIQNPKKAYEISAKIAGLTPDEIKELTDTTEFGNAELMAEASMDIERVLEGNAPQPNQLANTAYKQKFVDYMRDHLEDMTQTQFANMEAYLQACEPIVIRNMVRAMANAGVPMGQPQPVGAQPTQPVDLQALQANQPQDGVPTL